MDESGPVYNVRMKPGQGYNSYVQEPRIDNAVSITIIPGPDEKKPKDTTSDGKFPTGGPGTWDDFFTALLDHLNKSKSQTAGAAGAKDSVVLPYLLKPSPGAKMNQTVFFSSKQIKNVGEIDKAMGFKASAAIKAGTIGPGAEAGSNLASTDDVKSNDLNFLVHVKVVNEAVDRREKWEFNEVTDLRNRIKGLTGEDAHQKAVEFTKIYGDTFISDFVEGGEIYAWIGIKSQEQSKVNELRVYASAQLTPMAAPVQFAAETDFNKKRTAAFSQAETSIRVQWRGGGEIKTHNFQWGLDSLIQIANAFPSFVATTPAKIRAVLTPYSALKSFQDQKYDFSELNYDHCALYTSTLYDDFRSFSDLYDDISDMLEYPASYRRRQDQDSANEIKKGTGQRPDQGQISAMGELSRPSQKDQSDQPRSPGGASDTAPTLLLGSASVPQPTNQLYVDETEVTPKQETPLYRTLLGVQAIQEVLAEPSEPLVPIEPEPQKLSMMRFLCRSAMIYIQEQAAALVIDPQILVTTMDKTGHPQYRLPQYPCPGTIRNLLPVPTRDPLAAFDDDHLVDAVDLKFPARVERGRPGEYWWQTFGDPLSNFKHYDLFDLGNFDPDDEQDPIAISIHPQSSRWLKYVNKKARYRESVIAGIEFKYRRKPSSKPKDGQNPSVYTSFKGRNPGKKPPSESFKETLPVNRVGVFYKPGLGKISGLEFMIHKYPAEDGEPDVLASYKDWEAMVDNENVDPSPLIQGKMCFPGNSVDAESERRWKFAGLVGAFQKVGPFRRDRVLAKIAIVWKVARENN
jgi:hypothetical protein